MTPTPEAAAREVFRKRAQAAEADNKCLRETLYTILNHLQAWESIGGTRNADWPGERIKLVRAVLEHSR